MFELPHRIEIIRAHQARGGRIAAVLPIHYPRALFRAFDILPVEVWGPPRVDPTLGSAHLQPYVCSIVRNALSYLLADKLALTDFIVVPHTCDSLQGFASILIDFIKPRSVIASREAAKQSPSSESLPATLAPHASAGVTVLPIYLPRDQRPSDVEFLANEFRSLFQKLSAATQHTPSNDELMRCIVREEQADDLLARLHHDRKNLALSQTDLYRLIRSREYLPAETFIEIVGATLAVAHLGQPQGLPLRGIPIILSGIVPEPMTIFDAIAEMGGYVVADDFAACGRRLYAHGTSDDPFVRMAERIVNAPPDSTRGSVIQERCDHLLQMAKTSGAKGIVFYDVKFCEPELFYLPALRKSLQEAGVPSVAIEFDLNDAFSQQTRTRLEAFIEMLG
jgi:benzoyl-CoA reductase/2-hydroxyglutaryl-CoA dehydratase subunit BcrC/BadD/HgdB